MDCFNPVDGVGVEFPIRHATGSGNQPSEGQTQRRITRTINGRQRVDRSAWDEELSNCACVFIGYRMHSVGDAKSERIRSEV